MHLWSTKWAEYGQGNPTLIGVLACSLGFHTITQYFYENCQVSEALNLLVLLFGDLLAHSGRQHGKRHTHGHTNQVLLPSLCMHIEGYHTSCIDHILVQCIKYA